MVKNIIAYITFKGNKKAYRRGEYVEGTVELEVKKDTHIRNVRITIFGQALTKWQRGPHYVFNIEKEKYIGIYDILFGTEDSLQKYDILTAGTHEYKFDFKLDKDNLPSSYEGEYGAIRYWLKVNVKTPTISFDINSYRIFTVLDDINVNDLKFKGALKRYNTKSVSKALGFGDAGTLTLTTECVRKAYCPGETIALKILTKNGTSKDMGRVFAKLMQTVEFTADGAKKYRTTELNCIQSCDILKKGEEKDMKNAFINIAAVPPSSSPGACHIIEIDYYVKIYIGVPWGFDLSITLPITIGTVPYKHSAVPQAISDSFEIDTRGAITYTTCNKGVQYFDQFDGKFPNMDYTPLCAYVPNYKLPIPSDNTKASEASKLPPKTPVTAQKTIPASVVKIATNTQTNAYVPDFKLPIPSDNTKASEASKLPPKTLVTAQKTIPASVVKIATNTQTNAYVPDFKLHIPSDNTKASEASKLPPKTLVTAQKTTPASVVNIATNTQTNAVPASTNVSARKLTSYTVVTPPQASTIATPTSLVPILKSIASSPQTQAGSTTKVVTQTVPAAVPSTQATQSGTTLGGASSSNSPEAKVQVGSSPSSNEAVDINKEGTKSEPIASTLPQPPLSDKFLLVTRFPDSFIEEFRLYLINTKRQLADHDGEILAFAPQPINHEWKDRMCIALFVFPSEGKTTEWFRSCPLSGGAQWALKGDSFGVPMIEKHNPNLHLVKLGPGVGPVWLHCILTGVCTDHSAARCYENWQVSGSNNPGYKGLNVFKFRRLQYKAGLSKKKKLELSKFEQKFKDLRIKLGGIKITLHKPKLNLNGDWLTKHKSMYAHIVQWPSLLAYAENCLTYKEEKEEIAVCFDTLDNIIFQSEDLSAYKLSEMEKDPAEEETDQDAEETGGDEDMVAQTQNPDLKSADVVLNDLT